MDERKTRLSALRDGEPVDLFVRYTLPMSALRSSEVEVIDLELGITLGYGSPAEKILDDGFGAALKNGDSWSARHNVLAVPHAWEIPAESMQELRGFLVAVEAIEGARAPEQRGRFSSLAEPAAAPVAGIDDDLGV